MSGVTWKDTGWKKILDEAASSKELTLKIGVVGDKAEEQHEGSDLTVGEVAIVNELGTTDGHVPARPFVKPTFERDSAALTKELAEGLQMMLTGGMSIRAALIRVGRYGADQVRKTIRANVPPPNAESTLEGKAQRGSSGRQSKRTLIDTFQMINAVGYELIRGLTAGGDDGGVDEGGGE